VSIAVALAATGAASLAVHNIAFLFYAEQLVDDFRIALLLPAEPQDTNIVIVTITEETLAQFPYREPIDRGFLADLLHLIETMGPRAIAIDILFDQPTETAKDERLRRAIAEAPVPLVVSYVDLPAVVNEDQKEFLDAFVPPSSRVLANFSEDQFDTVRTIYPGHIDSNGRFLSGLARGLTMKLGVATPANEVPIAWHGQPAAKTLPFPIFPAHRLAILPKEWLRTFKDKVVLIGADYSLTDRHRTPFAATLRERAEGFLPGIVIHAHSVAQLLEGRSSGHVDWRINLMIALGLAAFGAWLGGLELELATRGAAGLAAVAAFWAIGFFELSHAARIMIELVAPTLAFALSMWLADSLGGREARRQREFVTSTFSRYVSPKVVRQLVDSRAPLTLDGDRRVMTFLFTDIADFTTLSETIESHRLAEMLNAYLDGVCRIVLKYDGMVDKFIGDAVFAIFNAPTEQADHPERAVKCALEIDEYAERFRRVRNGEGIALGVTRIGVHTGQATIGNFGSLLLKMDYTALGDAVNTASRLEGLNKYFGTRVCVSDTTRAQCETIAFRPLGIITLKGKATAHTVFEALRAPVDAEYVSRYEQAYASLAQRSPTALQLFAALHEERPLDPCVLMHLERLRSGELGAEIAMTEK
jgi:adenylate cyclase